MATKNVSAPSEPTKLNGCVIALLVAIGIFFFVVPILAAIVVLIINPIELTKRSRDAIRLADMADLQREINYQLETSPGTELCADGSPNCFGVSSYPGAQRSDGSGWVKIKFDRGGVLPIDPINKEPQVYHYCTDGKDWEISVPLESKQQLPRARQDEGDDPLQYEIGSSLKLCGLLEFPTR